MHREAGAATVAPGGQTAGLSGPNARGGQLDAYAVSGSSPPLPSTLAPTGERLVDATSFPLTLPGELLEAVSRRAAELAVAMLGEGKPYLSVEEAAGYLGWPKKRVYNLTAAKAIPHRKQGGRILFIRSELDRWVERLDGAGA
jgi:excisionase family DNA binding protein